MPSPALRLDRRPPLRFVAAAMVALVTGGLLLGDPLRFWHDGVPSTGTAVLTAVLGVGSVLTYAVFVSPVLRVEPGRLLLRNTLREWRFGADSVDRLALGRFHVEVHAGGLVLPSDAAEVRGRRGKRVEKLGAELEVMSQLLHSGPDPGLGVAAGWARPSVLQLVQGGFVAAYLLLGLSLGH